MHKIKPNTIIPCLLKTLSFTSMNYPDTIDIAHSTAKEWNMARCGQASKGEWPGGHLRIDWANWGKKIKTKMITRTKEADKTLFGGEK